MDVTSCQIAAFSGTSLRPLLSPLLLTRAKRSISFRYLTSSRDEAGAPILQRALQMMMADVIGAALEQRHGDRRLQRIAHGGMSRLNSWSCSVLVPVETMTLPPDSNAGTR